MSSPGSRADAQMSSDGSKEDAHSMVGGRQQDEVVVAGYQVTQLINTLRDFSDSCAYSRQVVETVLLEGADYMTRMKVEMSKAMKETDEIRKRSAAVLAELLVVGKRCKKATVKLQKEQAELTDEREKLSEEM